MRFEKLMSAIQKFGLKLNQGVTMSRQMLPKDLLEHLESGDRTIEVLKADRAANAAMAQAGPTTTIDALSAWNSLQGMQQNQMLSRQLQSPWSGATTSFGLTATTTSPFRWDYQEGGNNGVQA